MRLQKYIIPFAVLVLIAIIGVGVSSAQTGTPTPPTAPESTESPNATPETGVVRRGMGMGGMMQGMPMRAEIMELVTVGLDEAAKQTGMTSAEIIAAVHSGQTLADVIKSKNGDVQAVIDAVVKAATDKVNAAVTAGTLTQAQADKLTAGLTELVTNAVNGKLPMMMAGSMGRSGMNGFNPWGNFGNGPSGRPGMNGFNPWGNFGNGPFGRPGMNGFNPWANRGRGPFGRPGMGGFDRSNVSNNGMSAASVLMAAIANATNLKQGEIMRALRDGKTLSDVITANGSTVDAVINSAVTAETDFINGHVELGQITRENADKRIAGLKDQFTQMLTRSMGGGRHHGQNPMSTPEATPEATPSV